MSAISCIFLGINPNRQDKKDHRAEYDAIGRNIHKKTKILKKFMTITGDSTVHVDQEQLKRPSTGMGYMA